MGRKGSWPRRWIYFWRIATVGMSQREAISKGVFIDWCNIEQISAHISCCTEGIPYALYSDDVFALVSKRDSAAILLIFRRERRHMSWEVLVALMKVSEISYRKLLVWKVSHPIRIFPYSKIISGLQILHCIPPGTVSHTIICPPKSLGSRCHLLRTIVKC